MNQDIVETRSNKGHTVFFYTTQAERQRFLTGYFREGLATNHLCIFVSPDSTAKISHDFNEGGLDISVPLRTRAFRIFNMQETYLPNGEFVTKLMIHNVEQFIRDAERSGYKGLYTAGEMAWSDDPKLWRKLAAYEREVNTLQRHHKRFTALCLYPTSISAFIEDAALKTHPSQVFTGKVRPSTGYIEAE